MEVGSALSELQAVCIFHIVDLNHGDHIYTAVANEVSMRRFELNAKCQPATMLALTCFTCSL